MADEANEKVTLADRWENVKERLQRAKTKMAERQQEAERKRNIRLDERLSQARVRNQYLKKERKLQRLYKQEQKLSNSLGGSRGSIFGDSLFPSTKSSSNLFDSKSLFGASLFGEKERRRKKYYKRRKRH